VAAIFPGDWHHVVLRLYNGLNYAAYTEATDGESWFDGNDDGENRNGFKYGGSYLLGYQMPIFLNTAGVMVEHSKRLYAEAGGWGDDIIDWTFTVLTNFTLTSKISLALLCQFTTARNYLGDDISDWYKDRTLDTNNKTSLGFYRAAAIASIKLK
jgi:hypothetical protein